MRQTQTIQSQRSRHSPDHKLFKKELVKTRVVRKSSVRKDVRVRFSPEPPNVKRLERSHIWFFADCPEFNFKPSPGTPREGFLFLGARFREKDTKKEALGSLPNAVLNGRDVDTSRPF